MWSVVLMVQQDIFSPFLKCSRKMENKVKSERESESSESRRQSTIMMLCVAFVPSLLACNIFVKEKTVLNFFDNTAPGDLSKLCS